MHVGEDRLERLGLDGSLTTVADRPGTFSAPVWTADGRTFVYASVDADGQRLVARGVEAEKELQLVAYGLIAFVVSPDGERMAFQVIDEQRALPLSGIDVGTGETVPADELLALLRAARGPYALGNDCSRRRPSRLGPRGLSRDQPAAASPPPAPLTPPPSDRITPRCDGAWTHRRCRRGLGS